MTAALLPVTELAGPDTGDDEIDHLYCPCNPDLAMCGADVSGESVLEEPIHPECPLCLVIDKANGFQCVRCGE